MDHPGYRWLTGRDPLTLSFEFCRRIILFSPNYANPLCFTISFLCGIHEFAKEIDPSRIRIERVIGAGKFQVYTFKIMIP